MLYGRGARAPATGDPVVLIHGFTQSSATWEPVVRRLAAHHPVIALDAPGHGSWATVEADLQAGAAMIGDAGGRGAYVGYSMGGRFALHLALARPALVERLVLVSATAGIDDPEQRAARRRADEALAERIERHGVAEFVGWWLGRPMFATLPAGGAALDSRLVNTSAGLASSLRRAGTGTQEPLWDAVGGLAMPVLVVAGERDEPYLVVARRLAEAIGANATVVVVPGAGHSVPLEAPEAFTAAVEAFLARPAEPGDPEPE